MNNNNGTNTQGENKINILNPPRQNLNNAEKKHISIFSRLQNNLSDLSYDKNKKK